MKKLYLTCLNRGDSYEIVGIFDTMEAARELCTTDDHWFGELELNKNQGDETSQWGYYEYPTLE